jgi:hypothetical protein
MNKKLLHTLLSIFLAFFISFSVNAQNIFTPSPNACGIAKCTFQGNPMAGSAAISGPDFTGQCQQKCNATSGCTGLTVYPGWCNLFSNVGAGATAQSSETPLARFTAAPAPAPAPAPVPAPTAASAVSAAVISDLTNKINQLTAQVAALSQQQAARPDPKPAIDALTSQMAQVKVQVDKQTQQLANPPIPVSGVSAAVITDLTAKINTLSTRTDQLNIFMQKTAGNFSSISKYADCTRNAARIFMAGDRNPDIRAAAWARNATVMADAGNQIQGCQQILLNLQN